MEYHGGKNEDAKTKELKVDTFIENIKKVHLHVQETMKKLKDKYKAKYD